MGCRLTCSGGTRTVIDGVGCDSWGCHEQSATDRRPSEWTPDQVGGPGFWVVVFAVAGPLSAKLNSAQQNDASAWLPNNAESTQVVELAERFAPSDVFPALVVYERPDGPVTAADQAKAAADVQRFAAVQDVSGKVLGPIPSEDGRALQVVVPIKVAEEGNGWEELAPRVEEMRSIAQADTGGLEGVCDRTGRATSPTSARCSPASTLGCCTSPRRS